MSTAEGLRLMWDFFAVIGVFTTLAAAVTAALFTFDRRHKGDK